MEFPPSIGIRHIALKVRDLKRSEEFYTQVLGFKVEWNPDPKNLYLTSGLDNLALHEVIMDTLEDASGQNDRLDHFGILVKLSQHVDEWAKHLKNKGVVLLHEPKTHRDGARSLYFKDPDNNVIQIIYHPPISGI